MPGFGQGFWAGGVFGIGLDHCEATETAATAMTSVDNATFVVDGTVATAPADAANGYAYYRNAEIEIATADDISNASINFFCPASESIACGFIAPFVFGGWGTDDKPVTASWMTADIASAGIWTLIKG